jgi:hypothetical protein
MRFDATAPSIETARSWGSSQPEAAYRRLAPGSPQDRRVRSGGNGEIAFRQHERGP